MAYVRVILIALWLVVVCVLGLVACVFRWGDLNLDRDFGLVFGWGARRIAGLRVVLERSELLEAFQPCVYVGNHQSSIDLATFGGLCPSRTVVVGKKEVLWIPFFGLFFKAAGNIMIDRKKHERALASMDAAVDRIRRERVSVWIFPEGTRNHSGELLLPFKMGAFHMAFQAGVPVVPVVCEPIRRLVSWEKRTIKPGTVRMRVLSPIEPRGFADAAALAAETRSRMLNAIQELATAAAGS